MFAKIKIVLPGREQQPASLKAKVDTGAQGNIQPTRIFKDMCPNPQKELVKKSATISTAYNGTRIPQTGKISLKCKHEGNEWSNESFFIAETDGPAILGLPSCRALKMITLHCTVNKSTSSLVVIELDISMGNIILSWIPALLLSYMHQGNALSLYKTP